MPVRSNQIQQRQACASCKTQRRRCRDDCLLAQHFPSTMQEDFDNCHKLFGIRNIIKALESLDPSQRTAASQSMILEAKLRSIDPVGGCVRVINELDRQIGAGLAELDAVKEQLMYHRNQHDTHASHDTENNEIDRD